VFRQIGWLVAEHQPKGKFANEPNCPHYAKPLLAAVVLDCIILL